MPFDILAFRRRNLQLVGVDSLKLDAAHCAGVLAALLPGFDDGSLRAFAVDEGSLLPLDASGHACMAMRRLQGRDAGPGDRDSTARRRWPAVSA